MTQTDEVPYYAVCPICLEVFENPHSMNICGHILCLKCVSPDKCYCGTRNEGTHADYQLKEKLETISAKTACRSMLPLDEHREHFSNCDKCKNKRCSNNYVNKKPICKTNRLTFGCPICAAANLTTEGLLDHVKVKHPSGSSAICPICVSMPWGNPTQTVQNFTEHMKIRHRFDVELFADLNTDEDQVLRDIIELSKSAF
eukprot:GHVL01004406.1.p1 GENE.GHVL01004406.1~~GHVL01004406.1.p1  ORF type:complete len:200 (+),score=23.88 GHVL01004406.1:137-736(+)